MSKPDQLESRTVVTSGRGEVKITPSRVTVIFSAEYTGKTSAEARTKLQAVLAPITPLISGDDKRVLSDDRTLNPIKVYKQDEAPRVTGYKATATFTVLLTNIEAVTKFVDDIAAVGATSIADIQFGASDEQARKAEDEALKIATRNAYNKASAIMSVLAPSSKVKFIRVIEGDRGYSSPVYARTMSSAAQSEMASVQSSPISAGQLTVSCSVTLTTQASE